MPFVQFILIYIESGTSLTIGAGPGTGRNKLNGTQFSVWIFRLGIYGNFGLPLKTFPSFWKISSQANQKKSNQNVRFFFFFW